MRARLLAAVTATPPPSTYPHPVAHCDICIYWRHCDRQRRADDHPSLIAAISGAQVREFQQQGLPTVAAIAQREGRLPEKPKRGAEDTYRRLGQQARLQVASRGADMPQTEALALEPSRGLARLPEPSVGDIFLDFEGDPFVAPHGLEYLTGVSIKNENGGVEFNQRWALHFGEEKAALEAFIDFALARVQKHPGAHVYHFGAYEPAALKRLSARHATRGSELDQLLRGRRFVDLHAVVREGFRIGVERYGLKELEALHGFQRRLDLRDAGHARHELELALELGDPDAIADEIRERVAAYNGDDCLSTNSCAAGSSASATISSRAAKASSDRCPARWRQVRRSAPAISDRGPSGSVAARPAWDLETRTADERARALLAAMLGYYRQEEKNAGGSFSAFATCRATSTSRTSDARRARVRRAAPQAGTGAERGMPISFPDPGTAIDVGDKAVWPIPADPGEGPGTVKAQSKR